MVPEPLVPPGPVTVTETVPPPLGPRGTTTFITVLEATLKEPAVEPNFTAVVFKKPVPVMTAAFPPSVGPDVGLIPVMTGAGIVGEDAQAIAL